MLRVGGQIRVDPEVLYLFTTRVVPRRRVNQKPTLDTPERLIAKVGQTTTATFRATDPDSDSITFYAQFSDPQVTRLNDFASDLDDHGDGTAQLSLTPQNNQSGRYRLHVAAFDDAGAVTLKTIPLIVE